MSTSTATTSTADLNEALTMLRENREAIAWPERRHLAAQIAGPLAEGLAGDPFRALLQILVEDPKWEVRREVAGMLGSIPDPDLTLLAERMLEDSHAYVRRAAQQSIEHRRKLLRECQKRKRGLDLVRALDQEIEEQYGVPAAKSARRMAEHLYDVLVGFTVHEMRSVVTVLKDANLRILDQQARGVLQGAYLTTKCQVMGRRIEFLERMLYDMRSYTRAIPEERTTLNVANLVTEARSIVSEDLRSRNIATGRVILQATIPPALEVRGSRSHLVLALVNLLKNAYDALPLTPDGPQGRITLLARRQENTIRISVDDSGKGIAESHLEELKQFLPGRTTKPGHGTGFGLCCARRNVEAHGGRLVIASQEGSGTTVTLILPI